MKYAIEDWTAAEIHAVLLECNEKVARLAGHVARNTAYNPDGNTPGLLAQYNHAVIVAECVSTVWDAAAVKEQHANKRGAK